MQCRYDQRWRNIGKHLVLACFWLLTNSHGPQADNADSFASDGL